MSVYDAWPALGCLMAVLLLVSTPPFRSADLPPQAARPRLPGLDGLRGLAAFAVFLHHAVIYHAYLTEGVWRLPPSRFFSMAGQVGVAVFFLITGHLFGAMLIRERGRPRWAALYVGRLFRIGPTYGVAALFVLGAVAVDTGFVSRVPLPQLVGETARWLALGVLAVGPLNGDAQANLVLAGVTWTLQYEWTFYAALPLLASGIRASRGALVFAAALTLGCLGCWAAGWPHWLSGFDAIFALLFALGLGSAALRARGVSPMLPDAALSALALTALVLVFTLFPIAYGLAPTLLLAVAFHCIVSGGTLWGLLEAGPVRRLGDISYDVYILQGPVLYVVFAPGSLRGFALGGAAGYWLTVLVAALALVTVAAAAHAWVERPGMAGGRKIAAWLARSGSRAGDGIPAPRSLG